MDSSTVLPAAAASRPLSQRGWVRLGMVIWGTGLYALLNILIAPSIQRIYSDSEVFYAPAHFNDARQYVFICSQGYNVPFFTLPTVSRSRLNWMPAYPFLQCVLHQTSGLSLVFTGVVVSMFAIALSLWAASLTLEHLGVQFASINGLAVLTPIIGGAWLYLPSVEATYLAVGMVIMWLITLPTAQKPLSDLLRALFGIATGIVFVLTKPNALAFLLPLIFAFFYQSWQRSKRAGYTQAFGAFIADVFIEHLKPLIVRIGRLLRYTINLEGRPMEYDWSALAVATGITLGLAIWLAYSSIMSGVPFYFLQQQTTVWGRAWPSGNLSQMLLYFAQAFRGINAGHPWRLASAWNLSANLSALIPAASPRVPWLIRGMLVLAVLFILYSGAVHGSDRYILSTALVPIGWACWLAPTQKPKRWWVLRWAVVLILFVSTSLLLVNQMMPAGEPNAWGVKDY